MQAMRGSIPATMSAVCGAGGSARFVGVGGAGACDAGRTVVPFPESRNAAKTGMGVTTLKRSIGKTVAEQRGVEDGQRGKDDTAKAENFAGVHARGS